MNDIALRESYRECARLARRHGKTYALAAQLLPRERRRHVHAVYAFCRLADDIVDDFGDATIAQRRSALEAFGQRLKADLLAGHSVDPVLRAVVATVTATGVPVSCFDRFLRAMDTDLERSTHATWGDLCDYMDGSAAVIGEMMLPVLGGGGPRVVEAARALGMAFQLTNFIRDVGEDLDRGRVYLPQEDLERFGADPWRRSVDKEWRALMRFEIARTRRLYAIADDGIALLPKRSARCVWTARVLYARILDRVEAGDYDVFSRRATVPAPDKLAVATRSFLLGRPVVR